MKGLSLAMLVVLGLVLTFTPMISVYAEVQLPARIKFKCHALGSCVVFYGFARGWGQDPPLWYGSASGSIELNGHAKATSYEEIPPEGEQSTMYGMAYFTDPGGVKALGFLTLKWFENDERHQLVVAIYSKPTTQGVFQPDTDKFGAGFMGWGALPPEWEKPLLSYSGIYKIGSNVQYLSGPITVGASRIETPPPSWPTELEYIATCFWFGEYILTAYWWSETVIFPFPTPVTIPAAKILVRDVKLL